MKKIVLSICIVLTNNDIFVSASEEMTRSTIVREEERYAQILNRVQSRNGMRLQKKRYCGNRQLQTLSVSANSLNFTQQVSAWIETCEKAQEKTEA